MLGLFGLTRDFWILSASILLVNTFHIGFAFFIPLYFQELGAEIAVVGFALGVSRLINAVFYPIGGMLGDFVGRKNILIIGPMVGGAAYILLYYAPNWQTATVALAASVIPGAFTAPALSAYIAEVTRTERYGRAFGTYFAILNLSVVIGGALVGLISDMYGYRAAILITALSLFSSVFVRLFLREQKRDMKYVKFSEAFVNSAKMLGKPVIRAVLIFRANYLAITYAALTFLLAIYLRENNALSNFEIGLIYSADNLASAILSPVGGKLSEVMGVFGLLAFEVVVSAATLIILPFTEGFVLLLALLTVSSGLTVFFHPVTDSLLAKYSTTENRGYVFGAQQSLVAIVTTPAVLIAGVLWGAVGYIATFFIFSVLLLALIPLILLISSERRRAAL